MAKMTHSEVAAKLIVEGILGTLAGTVKGKLGIDPVVLTEREATSMGIPTGSGAPMFYPVDGKTGVFLDVLWSRTAVWYEAADAGRAAAAVEAMLKKAYPAAKMANDTPDPDDPLMHLRVYDVKLPDERMATIEMRTSTVAPPRFSAQIIAMGIKN